VSIRSPDTVGSSIMVFIRHGVKELSDDDYYLPLDTGPENKTRLPPKPKEDKECNGKHSDCVDPSELV
jgi:hypothetical protein